MPLTGINSSQHHRHLTATDGCKEKLIVFLVRLGGEKRGEEAAGRKNEQLVLLSNDPGFLWLFVWPKLECDWTLVCETGSCLCAV